MYSRFWTRCGIAFVAVLVSINLSAVLHAQPLKIAGSSIVVPPVADAMKQLKKEREIDVDVTSLGGVQAGLSSLGGGAPRIALLARTLEPEDRAALAELSLKEILVGRQVAALCVSADVWKSGIHELRADQIRGIYEGRITSWKELGGEDQPIKFFNWVEGYGMWELLATWLYESTNRAPKGKFSPIESNEEARNALEFTKGSIALMSPKLATEGSVFPISLVENKKVLSPTVEKVAVGEYPLTRPLMLVIDDQAVGSVKVAIQFLLSPKGQKCFEKHGFMTAAELEAKGGQ